jgi:predicted polyphosphate/ATP-dependent NAD kinase
VEGEEAVKVLACGGRDCTDARRVSTVLSKLHARTPVSTLVTGGASGADALAERWAVAHGVPCARYPADWGAHGRAAGPIRNAAMLRAERPALVVAFPGGKGTADLVARARAMKIPVMEP